MALLFLLFLFISFFFIYIKLNSNFKFENNFFCIVNVESFHIVCLDRISIFFFLRPVTLPQPGLGRIAEQVQVLVA